MQKQKLRNLLIGLVLSLSALSKAGPNDPCNEVVQACEEAVEAQQRVIEFQDEHIKTLKTLNLTSSQEIERLRLKHDTKWNPWVIGIIGFLGGALTYSVVK